MDRMCCGRPQTSEKKCSQAAWDHVKANTWQSLMQAWLNQGMFNNNNNNMFHASSHEQLGMLSAHLVLAPVLCQHSKLNARL